MDRRVALRLLLGMACAGANLLLPAPSAIAGLAKAGPHSRPGSRTTPDAPTGSLAPSRGRFPVPGRKPAPPAAPRVVMLDPGHGGHDPGAIGGRGTWEKDITLDLALEMARALDEQPGITVRLTRDRDVFLPLPERVEKARRFRADLFLSLHADSAPNREARGLSAYTLSSKGSDDFSRALAQRENLAGRNGGVDLRHTDADVAAILVDLAARHTLNAALKVRSELVRGVEGTVRLLDNPMRAANFAVLRAPDVPSVLVETGFLSNPEDEAMLREPRQRRTLARLLAREVAELLARAPFA